MDGEHGDPGVRLLFRLGDPGLFASPSNRWSDPRARLLDGPRWEAVREDVLAGLSPQDPVEEHLTALVKALDAAWRQMADRLAEACDAAKVEIVIPEGGGRAKLSVEKLGQIGEGPSLAWLRETTDAMLPRIDLHDLLFEVHSWTAFLDAFTHVSTRSTRMKALMTSLVALLVSEACNIGLTPVANPSIEALTRSRLSHVDQNYLRGDTIAAANAALIELASVDGLRFVVPVRTLHAAPSPKYFGFKRGITWLNAVNDQVAGIGQMVVPGTPRDSLFILDTLLNLDGGVRLEMVTTDHASYSDMVFGIFKMLGFRFAPRFRDLADQRFWRAEMPDVETGIYGPLGAIARHRVNLARDRNAMAGHAPGRRVPDHQPSPRLRSFAHVRTRRPPHAAGPRVRGVSPGRRHLPADRQPPTHHPGIPAHPGPVDLPRPTRHHRPALPRRAGRPAGVPRPGAQRRRPLEHPLS